MIINRKIVVYTLLLLAFSFSCKRDLNTNNEQIMNQSKNSEMKEYYIVFKSPYPFEILVNDVMVEKEFKNGLNGANSLNQFILNSGVQKIKIKIAHPFAINGGMLKSKDLESFEAAIYITDKSNVKIKEVLTKLKFPKINQPVPYIEHTWEFDAELPFDLVGWKNSEDLRKLDSNVLKKQVLEKFQKIRETLNNGNSSNFMEKIRTPLKEFYKSNYFTELEKKNYESNLLDFYSQQKGKMLPIVNYKLRVLGEGKVVTLEFIKDHFGECVLLAENKKNNTLYLNYLMLHKSKDSNEFKIIRINSKFTALTDE